MLTDFFSSTLSWSSGTISYALPFLFVLSVVVFFHELGHFLMARLFSVKVEAFSLGFGPELYGKNDRHGTRWRLSLVPLGGYVKFLGDDTVASSPEKLKKLEAYDEETRKGLFQLKPVWQRALIVVAGPLANFLLTIAIFTLLFAFAGRAIIEPRIGQILPGSPAETAGFQPGDVVLDVDGHAIGSFAEIQRYVAVSEGNPMLIHVKRQGRDMALTATPRLDTVNERIGGTQKIWRLGFTADTSPGQIRYERHDPATSLLLGMQETGFLIKQTLIFVKGLFIGRVPIQELGGPIRIAEVAHQAAGISFTALVSLTAVLSVSIGLLNLFPIPMLDGGHLVFYAIEAIRRRPLSERAQEMGFRLGLAMVLTLMVIAFWSDISRHFVS